MLKKVTLTLLVFISISYSYAQKVKQDSLQVKQLEEIVISGTRAGVTTPVTYQNVSKQEVEKRNLGQDLPYMLSATPSLVYTSDAGTGIGYTGMRIRGSDATRVNVTINGIPFNDPESQGTFWVDLPDFSSSLNSIQIQRGVGTSTNGSGAFGASVNLETNTHNPEAFAEVNNSYGSFNTHKHNIFLNSGLLNNKWSFEGKLSKILSDGYVDRATADLGSYFLSGNYMGKNTIIKALFFGGKEVTYQSWNGIEQNKMKEDRTYNSAGSYTDDNGDEQFYDREVDNYQQDHFQLHLSQRISEVWTFSAALHYTKGKGYYEQYKQNQDFGDYDLPNVVIGDSTISETDLIRRRWLNNDFYGFTYGLNYENNGLSAVLGGGYSYYDGGHYGEVIWAKYASTGSIRHRYYDNDGKKKDFNTYLKVNYTFNSNLSLFGDLQMRLVDYHTQGIDSDRRPIDTGNNHSFFNPKLGVNYALNNGASLYASYAIGNREPVRNDFIDSPTLPKHETLGDLEIGYKTQSDRYHFGANLYYMNYKNQLVLTGALNDVGGSIRTNVDHSYRAGLELTGGYNFGKMLHWTGNLTLSQNKIDKYVENLNDYQEGGVVTKTYDNTNISYSPNVVGASELVFTPVKGLDMTLFSKYVGQQYLDNTSDASRILKSYFVNDLIVNYNFTTNFIKEIGINLMVNNLFNLQYESNGYAFGYYYGEEYREVYYYPQAGINFLAGLSLKF